MPLLKGNSPVRGNVCNADKRVPVSGRKGGPLAVERFRVRNKPTTTTHTTRNGETDTAEPCPYGNPFTDFVVSVRRTASSVYNRSEALQSSNITLPALKGKVADRRSDGRVSHFHFQLLTFNFKLWRHSTLKKHFRRSAFFYNYLFFLASFSASFSALSCLAFSAFSASSLFCSSILAVLSASYLDFDSSYFESSSSR